METPILLITFNRPDHTRQTLQRILESRPRELYIFQDGAREENANDTLKCQQVRDVINELIVINQSENNTDLHTYYSSKNLGCGAGPMTGISWFFDNVEQGIVMEDDCLAHPDFFPYCEELLNRYKGTDVKFLNATLYDNRWSCVDSYGFSRYMVTGAWASYRTVWRGFDLDLKDICAIKYAWQIYRLTHNMAEAEWWWYQMRAIQQDESKKSYWDYQMQIHLFQQKALTIHPSVNLISNIGFDTEGTHTLCNDGRGDRAALSILPLNHPQSIQTNWKRDMRCWAKKQSKGVFLDLLYILYHLLTWRRKFVR